MATRSGASTAGAQLPGARPGNAATRRKNGGDAHDPDETSSFAAALRAHRLAAGLTQEALAERAGLSRRGVQEAERGLIRPQRETVQRLADALQLAGDKRERFLALAQPRPRARLERSLRLVPRALAEPGEDVRPRHNLPVQLTSFVGRERELMALARLLDPRTAAARLVTLTGPGGSGKTRLAMELAAQLLGPAPPADARRRAAPAAPPGDVGDEAALYPDGVWLIELGALANPALLPQAVAAVLQVRAAVNQPLVEALLDALRERQTLLLLDTCEHMLDACAELAEALLRGCGALRLLATSREPLGVAGETRWPVPSLGLPAEQAPPLARLARAPAVRLFVERATLASPGFRLTERNAPAVAKICRRLDGLPLALELAAARVPQLSAPELAARLDQRLQLLTGGSRTAAARHQTMRATIDWSYNLLDAAEQACFRRLAVFPTSFTLDAALMVWGAAAEAPPAVEIDSHSDTPPQEPSLGPRQGAPALHPSAPSPIQDLDLLVRLVEKSLVLAEEQADGSTRYRLLDTLRDYAWERLRASGEAAGAQERHAAFHRGLDDLGDGGEALRQEVRAGYENLTTALRWYVETGQAAAGLSLAAALSHFWHTPEARREGRAWFARLLALPEAGGTLRLRGLEAAGWLAWQQGDFAAARACYAEGVALAEQGGDLAFQACFQWGFGEVDLVEANWGLTKTPQVERQLAFARAHFERSLALARASGGSRELTVALIRLGDAHRAQGDYAAASARYAESLEAGGNRAWSLARLASVAVRTGDPARVRDLLRQSVPLYRALPDWPYLRLNCLSILGGLAAREGRMVQAARFVGAWERLAEQMAFAPLPQARHRLPIEHGAASMVAERLGAAAFAAARAEGEQMDLDRAIDEALAAAPRE